MIPTLPTLPFAFEQPLVLWLLLLLPLFVLVWFVRGMRTVPAAVLLRVLSVAMLILAVARPTFGQPIQDDLPIVILADQSDSLTPTGQAAARQAAADIAAQVESGDSQQAATLIWFGDDTVTPGGDVATAGGTPDAASTAAYNPTQTDLAGALRAARDLLAPGDTPADGTQRGRVVIISDGRETVSTLQAEARLAADAGLVVDVLPIDVAGAPEVRLVSVEAPRTLRVGEEYDVDITVESTAPDGQPAPATATLRLWSADDLLGEQQVTLQPGTNRFTFPTRALSAGVVRLRGEVLATPDTFAANNEAGATAVVAPPSRVLLVEGRQGTAQQLTAALLNEGIESETIAAAQMPTRLSPLDGFDGMVLLDVTANDLSFDQMATVQEFVRSEGRGLVVTGGTGSYGLGGYADTPLEETLPVDMDAPPRPERNEVALLLIIDRSASMEADVGVSKFAMAKEAAILSTETLRNEDTIGVLAFDTSQQWVVDFQQVGQGAGLQAIQDSIATLPTGGGTDIFAALQVGLRDLEQLPNRTRHVVLLTDGRSFSDDRNAYRVLAENAKAQDITISTIAIGFDADTQLLDDLARWGGGRYYFADAPEDIPALTLQESEIARNDPAVEGIFQAGLAQPHPLVRNFAPVALPTLDGYVATTPRDAAEVVLVSQEGDPVLAAWQYGLGRAVAWTPSVGEPWANAWTTWDDYGRFWGQVVRYTLPDIESRQLQIEVVTDQRGTSRLIASGRLASGRPLDLANMVARVTLPDGETRTFNLRQTAPGEYSQPVVLPDPGAYGIVAVAERNGQQFRSEAGHVQPVSPEYLPLTGDNTQGVATLQAAADLTGGTVLAEASTLDTQNERPTPPDERSPWSQPWVWLLTAALFFWVLEIAVRRGLFMRDR